jgi:hypothetical protein
MEKYVEYLLADIAQATAAAPAWGTDHDDDEDDPFLSVEEEAQSAAYEVLGQRVGLKPEWFPPAARLDEDQLQCILDALGDCLDAHGFTVRFPIGLPLAQQYQAVVGHLSQEVPLLSYNHWEINLCDSDPQNCPFGAAHCQCKIYSQWLDQLVDDEEILAFKSLEELFNPQLGLLEHFLEGLNQVMSQAIEMDEEMFDELDGDEDGDPSAGGEGGAPDQGPFFDFRDLGLDPGEENWN